MDSREVMHRGRPTRGIRDSFYGDVAKRQPEELGACSVPCFGRLLAYLIEENRVLRRQMVGRRLRLADDDRPKLAARAYLVRRALRDVATLVTPSVQSKKNVLSG